MLENRDRLNSHNRSPLAYWMNKASEPLYHSVLLYINRWFCLFHSLASLSIHITLWIINHKVLKHLSGNAKKTIAEQWEIKVFSKAKSIVIRVHQYYKSLSSFIFLYNIISSQ